MVGRWFSEYLDEILSKVLPPLSVLAVSQPIGPKWHCWSGLGHAHLIQHQAQNLDGFPSIKCPSQTGPSGTVGQDFRTLPGAFTSSFLTWPCPNQAGQCGAVGRDSDMLSQPASSTKLLMDFFPKKRSSTERTQVALLVRTSDLLP